jgi:hypothetical protein
MKKVPNANGALDAGYKTISMATTTAVKSNLMVTVDMKALTNLIGDFSTAPFTHLYITRFRIAKTTGTIIKVKGISHFRVEK